MSQLHLGAGSTCPLLSTGTLRLYSMVFCPYAQRSRLVLAHKNIPFEVVNVDLAKKPEWYFKKNDGGKVPTLEQDGKLIIESAICMDYLDEAYPDNNLNPSDPYERAQAKMKMEIMNKVISGYYGLFLAKEDGEAFQKLETQFSIFNNLIDGKFISGDKISMVDYYIWPWIERTCIIKTLLGKDMIDQGKYPKLHAWFSNMMEDSAVKACLISPENHLKFVVSYKAGNPEYDFMYK